MARKVYRITPAGTRWELKHEGALLYSHENKDPGGLSGAEPCESKRAEPAGGPPGRRKHRVRVHLRRRSLPAGRVMAEWQRLVDAAVTALRNRAWDLKSRYEALSDDEKSFAKGLGGLALLGTLETWRRSTMAKRVFISYDYDNDRHYRQLLSAWDANEDFDFEFEDHSTPYINSDDAGRIKAAISRKMSAAKCLLVIVGEKTSTSTWVDWEIEKAKELGLSLVGVKIKNTYTTPSGLLNAGASWARAFDRDPIVKAIAFC